MATQVGHPRLQGAFLAITIIVAAGGFAYLSVIAYGNAFTAADVEISQWIQAVHFPGLSAILTSASFLTSSHIAIALWMVTTVFLILRGRPLEAIAIFAIGGLWAVNQFLGAIVARPFPSTEVEGTAQFSRDVGGSFPSGHVTGAVVFYGVLTYLTLSNVRHSRLRWFIPAMSVTIVGLTAISRIYLGAHWPSDVLGSFLLGFLGIVSIAWIYTTIKEDRLSLPRLPWRDEKQPEEPIDGITLAGSIASTVYLDSKAGTATKEYDPPWPVRALYWLAFQAPFPYKGRSDALEAASAKRKLAALLTKYKFGYDMVAAVCEVDCTHSTCRFVTELVQGSEPESNREIEGFLTDLYSFFQEVGLPTWQISPANPHAYSNFIRNHEGELKLIDLESAIVSFSLPFGEFRSALRDGHYPAFDDVDFVRLRKYVAANASDLRESLGRENLEELNQAIEIADDCSHQWRHSEPRIWGKIGQRVYRIFDLSGVIAWSQRRLIGAEIKAQDFLNAAVDRWEHEGRIDDMEAARLRDSLATSEVTNLTRHLGAHLVISVALRFPIGSLARFGWTVGFRVKARKDLSKGTITAEQYAAAKSIHSISVMLISLIPGLGTIAYFASSTVRKTGFSRLLIDQFIYKLPFRLYYRLRLSCAIAPCPLSAKISNDFTPHLHK